MQENIRHFFGVSEKIITFAVANKKTSRSGAVVARQAHNLEVACSNPASATTESARLRWSCACFFVKIRTNIWNEIGKRLFLLTNLYIILIYQHKI